MNRYQEKALPLLNLFSQRKTDFFVNMEWNNLIIFLALVMQITFANTASVDTESISYFNPIISLEKSDPDDPVPIPLESTLLRAAQPCDQQR